MKTWQRPPRPGSVRHHGGGNTDVAPCAIPADQSATLSGVPDAWLLGPSWPTLLQRRRLRWQPGSSPVAGMSQADELIGNPGKTFPGTASNIRERFAREGQSERPSEKHL